MQVGDLITLINAAKEEVEVEVMKIYSAIDESSKKPSVLADLRETATDRLHVLVPQKQFIKGARTIQYYLERPVTKPLTPSPDTPKQPDAKKPDTVKTNPKTEPDAVDTTVTAETDTASIAAPDTAPQKPKGQAKTIGVGDNVASSDK